MAEPSKDRDKAVEEAQDRLLEESRHIVLDWLWQRAQEAEREENCKAVCDLCARGVALKQHPGHGWVHVVKGAMLGGNPHHPNMATCRADAIRNRAARASEEPKP